MASASPDVKARRRQTVLALVVGVVAGLVLVALIAVLAVARGNAGASSASLYRGSEPPVRLVLPDFDQRTYRGARLRARDLRGKVVMLTVLDSQCTESCPLLATVIARGMDRLARSERAEVRAVAVTADPAEDTAASVRRFLRARRADGRLDYLIGEESELRPLWRALYVLTSLDSGRDDVHSAPLRIYDRQGVWVATLHVGVDLNEENLLHDVRTALRASGDDEAATR